jgi:hypothetical protein
MARKINERLIERMINGDLVLMLNYIKKESKKLRLEVRQVGKDFIYYKKCKVLDLGLDSYSIDKKYFENSQKPNDIRDKLIKNPEQYFKDTLPVVDRWLQKHRKEEFETQQNIARENQEENNRYIILNMEYNFSQDKIKGDDRVKRAGFDLLGVERQTGKIVFFEVKKGLKALRAKAGIRSHILDFEECLFGRNKIEFRNNLTRDLINIVSDKKRLGLIDNFDLPEIISNDDVELIFIFEPVACGEDDYLKIFKEEYQKSGSKREYRTINISKNNFKLT